MARNPTEQGIIRLDDQPDDAESWRQILRAALADAKHAGELLPLAEQALRAHPEDGHVLLLATTAALIDRRPARAQILLQRFAKLYKAISAYHLLRALALAQADQPQQARDMLEANGLAFRFAALQSFPGSPARRDWLVGELNQIFDRTSGGRRTAARGVGADKPKKPGTSRSRPQARRPRRPSPQRKKHPRPRNPLPRRRPSRRRPLPCR